MMSANQAIAVYAALADISSQMWGAARRNDWECLVALDSRHTGLISDLKGHALASPLTDEDRERMIGLINLALDNHRAIADVIGPYLAQLSSLLGSLRTERKLLDAYSLSFAGPE